MKWSLVKTGITLVISALALPALCLGASPAPGLRKADSMPIVNEVDTARTSRLLNRMQYQAVRVSNDAEQLQSYAYEDLSWQSDAYMIDRMADRLRKMDAMLYDLRVMKPYVVPAQSHVIWRLTPHVIVLTDEMNTAIRFINKNHDRLWEPQWNAYVGEMSRCSSLVQKDLRNIKQVQEEAHIQTLPVESGAVTG